SSGSGPPPYWATISADRVNAPGTLTSPALAGARMHKIPSEPGETTPVFPSDLVITTEGSMHSTHLRSAFAQVGEDHRRRDHAILGGRPERRSIGELGPHFAAEGPFVRLGGDAHRAPCMLTSRNDGHGFNDMLEEIPSCAELRGFIGGGAGVDR